MAVLPPDLDFKVDKAATPDRMNRAMTAIDARLRGIETYKPNFDAQLATIQQVGLDRLNAVIRPVYEELLSIADIGVIFQATSSSAVTVGIGVGTFVIDAPLRERFAPAAWIVATTTDESAAVAGRSVSYDRASGELRIDIVEGFGAGLHASWRIVASAPTQLAYGGAPVCVDDPQPVHPVFTGYLAPELLTGVRAYVDARIQNFLSDLPVDLPSTLGTWWLNGGVLPQRTDGPVTHIALPDLSGLLSPEARAGLEDYVIAQLKNFLADLPKTLPATPGVWWLDGGLLKRTI